MTKLVADAFRNKTVQSFYGIVVLHLAMRLGKSTIIAYQASERGGELRCELKNDRVIIAGNAALYSVSELNL